MEIKSLIGQITKPIYLLMLKFLMICFIALHTIIFLIIKYSSIILSISKHLYNNVQAVCVCHQTHKILITGTKKPLKFYLR